VTVIDADGHVEESPAKFSFLARESYARRPLPLGFDRDTAYGDANAVWFIDGKTYLKLYGKGGVIFLTPTTDDLKLEAALFKAYNNFMADACNSSSGLRLSSRRFIS